VLQSLAAREAKWLFHHFRVNIPPVLFSEVLGDLAKTRHLATGTPDGDVRMLSAKIISHSIYLNEAHYNLVSGELYGHRVDMDGRPIVSNAKSAKMPDGSTGWNQSNRPSPAGFLPYTAFVARLEAIFVFGLHAGVVTTRATNRIDIVQIPPIHRGILKW
jgi:hypothetical protein